jgi:solute carrier family 25 oxoglutarate transporter 11
MSFYDFIFAGMSGMTATSVIQPIDTVKVRIQIVGEAGGKGHDKSPFVVARNLYAADGIRGFYKGLDSALFRQATYSTARLGLYKYLYNKRTEAAGKVKTWEKAMMSLFAGFVGSLVGNPADIVLVRFQSDSSLPLQQRRNYKHVFDAFVRIVREEGLWTLWRGSGPTIARAMAMNLGMLTTYDEVKERLNTLRGTKDTMSTQIISSFSAGIVCSFLSLPFDNAKTKIQKMAKNPEGKLPYNGLVDCMTKTVKREGLQGLWAGYPTFYVRVGIHSMITLLVQDYLQHHFNPNNKK